MFPGIREQRDFQYVYLDSAATTLRPQLVIDAIVDFYSRTNANPGATLHRFARQASEAYEQARADVARFIHALSPEEIVWTRGTTEGINLVASTWGSANIHEGDEIVLTLAEHYSNLVPWQLLARRTGATLRFLDVTDDGELKLDELDALLTSRTKLVGFPHVSNVLGIINPARTICQKAHSVGAKVLIDGAQSIPHIPVDVQALECDFFAFSSHKMLGPMGIGVLWARQELLDAMPPYQAGSNMAHEVQLDGSGEFARGAHKFGAGTPNVEGTVGLAAAIRFLGLYDPEMRWAHEQTLTEQMLEQMGSIEGIRILGNVAAKRRISLFAFVVEGLPSEKLVSRLDEAGFAIRAGDMASYPLLKRLGLTSAARVSAYLYNTADDINRFVEQLNYNLHPGVPARS